MHAAVHLIVEAFYLAGVHKYGPLAAEYSS